MLKSLFILIILSFCMGCPDRPTVKIWNGTIKKLQISYKCYQSSVNKIEKEETLDPSTYGTANHTTLAVPFDWHKCEITLERK